MKKPIYCPECGIAGVSHFFAKMNLLVGFLAECMTLPLAPIVRFLGRIFSSYVDFLIYWLFCLLSFFRIVRLVHSPSVQKDTDRTKCMWSAGERKGVKIKEVWVMGRPINIFLADLPFGRKIIFEGLPRPSVSSDSLDWMDDKGVMKKKFRRAGFPVPNGETCFTFFCAKRIFKNIRKNGGSVVVKPTLGSRSRHTRVHIKTLDQLKDAFRIAKQICPFVSVEEELRGVVYRISIIGGRIAGVLRRDPPFVLGDGRHSIRELIVIANTNPKRHGPIFHEIPNVSLELDLALNYEKFDKDDVPASGRRVLVGTKIGRSQGGTNIDVTDMVHVENRKLFLDIAKFLGDPLVGIDFIIEDIRRPWRSEMPCGIIELNSVPFLDLHMYPFEGKARDLSEILWDEVLKY